MCQSFVLNPNFKLNPEHEYHAVSDDNELALPFENKPDPTKQIDWDAVRAQPRSRVEDSPAKKAAVMNLKKRKSEEEFEEDQDEIKKK